MPKRKEDRAMENDDETPRSKKPKGASVSGNELKRAEGKTPVNTATQKDDEGNEFWEASHLRLGPRARLTLC